MSFVPGLLVVLGALASRQSERERVPAVEARRLPEGELQPQIAVGADGLLHMLTYRGDPAAGELVLRRFRAQEAWSDPILVGAGAFACGTGGQIALGREGREHVVWAAAAASGGRGEPSDVPIRTARTSADGRGFEAALEVASAHSGADSGPAIAADAKGHVWVAWHAPESGAADERRVWIVRSSDGGGTFEAEHLVDPLAPAACGCCRVALASSGERVYLLYRSARARDQRGMMLAVSWDGGARFQLRELDDWQTERCPLSSASLLVTPDGAIAAWERAGSISRAWLAGIQTVRESRVTRTVAGSDGWGPRGTRAELQHPSLALGAGGALLTTSLADVHFGKEAKLDWHLEDRDGKFLGMAPRPIQPVPDWDLPAVFARPDGSFVIVY